MPITRGWWLVAYLFLVGGIAQILLGPGLIAIAEHARARVPSHDASLMQLILWNVGTVTVAAADLSATPAGVLAGSLLLLVALATFALSLRRVKMTARRPARGWIGGYALLIAFLVGSTLIGAALAGAIPTQ